MDIRELAGIAIITIVVFSGAMLVWRLLLDRKRRIRANR